MKKLSLLAWSYLLCAVAGFIIPWYHILRHIRETGEGPGLREFIDAGRITPLTSSLTTDFLIAGTAVMIWMIAEGRRLRMKRLWMYPLFTCCIAFAFACPFFLFMRERHLAATTNNPV